jgi:hypothetical protein
MYAIQWSVKFDQCEQVFPFCFYFLCLDGRKGAEPTAQTLKAKYDTVILQQT